MDHRIDQLILLYDRFRNGGLFVMTTGLGLDLAKVVEYVNENGTFFTVSLTAIGVLTSVVCSIVALILKIKLARASGSLDK